MLLEPALSIILAPELFPEPALLVILAPGLFGGRGRLFPGPQAVVPNRLGTPWVVPNKRGSLITRLFRGGESGALAAFSFLQPPFSLREPIGCRHLGLPVPH
jgi:hypothetical protein